MTTRRLYPTLSLMTHTAARAQNLPELALQALLLLGLLLIGAAGRVVIA